MNDRRMELAFGVSLLLLGWLCHGTIAGPAADGTKRLALYPPGRSTPESELRLLPTDQETTDGDAFALYEKAGEALPTVIGWERIMDWRHVPPKELPLEEVGSVLQPFEASLRLVEQAVRCRHCDWPLIIEDKIPAHLQACRSFALVLGLRAHYELARGGCDSCARAIGANLALAKHLSTGPNILHLLYGSAVTALACGELEFYVQQPGAPSLETALRRIPTPLFDEAHSEIYGADPNSQARIRLILKRANRHIAVLQTVESLRSWTAKDGEWPETLDALKTSLPEDPVTGRPFDYRRVTKTQAILEGLLPEGVAPKHILRYELNLQSKGTTDGGV